MQDAWTAGIGGEKGKKEINEKKKKKETGSRVEENAIFSIQLFLALRPHCITIGYF